MSARRWLAGAVACLAAAGCDNAGFGRTTGISATGVVRGTVTFDANGSGTSDAADVVFVGARIRLLAPTSADTLFRATSDADGVFRFSNVPVGTYQLVVDSLSVGDSALVLAGNAQLLLVPPDDSVETAIVAGYPTLTVAEARATAFTGRFFVSGIVFNARTTFGDTTVHLFDSTGTVRAARVRATVPAFGAGDSVRVRAMAGVRLGQPILDDATVFVIGSSFVPEATTLTTVLAATADGATRDAALVRLLDAAITDTATVLGNLTMTMDDGSGPVTVVLDRAADLAFRPPLAPNQYEAPNRFDIVGVLVPTGTGTWVVKPRSVLDLVRR